MAEWWDWSSASADRDEAVRQRAARQRLADTEAEYDRAVAEARAAIERARERDMAGSTPWDAPLPRYYRQLPPEARMADMLEVGAITPKNPSPGYTRFLGEAVRYPLEVGARPRDTAIRSAQELAQGNLLAGLGYMAAAPLSVVAPAVAAGRSGDQDDWREAGRRHGVSERDLLLLDIATDPATYLTFGAVPAARSAAVGLVSRADDLIRSLRGSAGVMRYGRGAPTYLEDASGQMLRRLPNSPAALGGLALPPP